MNILIFIAALFVILCAFAVPLVLMHGMIQVICKILFHVEDEYGYKDMKPCCSGYEDMTTEIEDLQAEIDRLQLKAQDNLEKDCFDTRPRLRLLQGGLVMKDYNTC